MCQDSDRPHESRQNPSRAGVALAFRALRTAPLARQLATVVTDAADAMSELTVERKRMAHLPLGGDSSSLDDALRRCHRHRALLSVVVRRATREPFDAGADLASVISEFRTVVCALLDAADIREPWHEMVLAEVSTACVIEFYARSHLGRLTLSDAVLRREAERQLSRSDSHEQP